jgi:FkbM family methyltransferase
VEPVERVLERGWHALGAHLPPGVTDALARHRVAQRTAAAFVTARPFRFLACDLVCGKRLARHQLRDAAWTFCIHHGTTDVAVLDEIFRLGHYSLPLNAPLPREGRPLRVVDLGAHIGLFGLFVLRRYPSAHVVAFEPDPRNFRALSCTVRSNRPRTDHWEAVQACATPANGTAHLLAEESLGCRMVPASEPGSITVAARDVFPYLTDVDLLKIDIEGGEWALLDDSRFAYVSPQLLFLEYHTHLCASADPRRRAIETLQRHGYEVRDVFTMARGIGLLRAVRGPVIDLTEA